jgi:hypothetical protein
MYTQKYRSKVYRNTLMALSEGQECRNTVKILVHEEQVNRITSKGAYGKEKKERNTTEHIHTEGQEDKNKLKN